MGKHNRTLKAENIKRLINIINWMINNLEGSKVKSHFKATFSLQERLDCFRNTGRATWKLMLLNLL